MGEGWIALLTARHGCVTMAGLGKAYRPGSGLKEAIRVKKLLGLVLVLVGPTALGANVSASLSITPTSSNSPIAATVSWTSSGAGLCTASGGWSGVKGSSGSELLPSVSKTTIFTLTCTSPTGPATLSWTPPTLFTDGSTLSTLTGYQVMMGQDTNNLARGPLLPATPNNATIQAPSGKTFFALRSEATLNGLTIESVDTPQVSKTVVADTVMQSVTLTIAVVPNPPTNLVVQ